MFLRYFFSAHHYKMHPIIPFIVIQHIAKHTKLYNI